MGVAVFVVLALLVPLLWWQFLGPERIEGLELGAEPDHTIALEDFGDVTGDAVIVEPSADAEATRPEPVIELPPLTMSSSTVVTLVFSVGSNGMTQSDASRLRVGDIGDRGRDNLTDSMMLLVSDPPTRKAALLSIPRDLWLSHRGHRINETFARRGAQAFIDDVSRVSGLPIHHLVQVNFTAFADLVDAVDGITVQVPSPLADLYAALYIPSAGCWRLDGATALAYARSRHGLTTRDGGRTWRTAPDGNDFSRIRRQQTMAAAAWDQLRGRNIVRRLPDLVRLADGISIDAGLGIDDIVDLARAFQDVAAGRVEGHTLPVVDRRIGEAYVLGISWSRALPLYARLRSWPPSSTASSGQPAPSEEPSSPASPTASEPSDGSSPAPGSSDGTASEAPTADPTASPSQDASPTPDPAPAAAIPATGCPRSQAFELPSNPLDYLAAIADGDPTPPYEPTRARPARDPEPTDDPTEPAPSEQPTSEPSEEPVPTAPTPEPTATDDPTICLPSCEEGEAGGDGAGQPTGDPGGDDPGGEDPGGGGGTAGHSKP